MSPDGTFAVFSGQRSVRAVGADGKTLWVYRHGCWGPVLDHPHTGDEQEVCYGLEHGSCRISDDGRLVWAHVPHRDADDDGEYWVVLDAGDGRELARFELETAAAGSSHVSHPDGTHMGLAVGMGQDGVLTFWGRWDGASLTVHDGLNDGLDRMLVDAHPDGAGFLTIEHDGADLRTHAPDGTLLAEADASAVAGPDDARWDGACGFLDCDTVLATTGVEYEEEPEQHGTWLLDARTLEKRARITYPTGPADGTVRALGDGTWLTCDATTYDTLHRWRLAN